MIELKALDPVADGVEMENRPAVLRLYPADFFFY